MNVEGVFGGLVAQGATWVLWTLVGLSVVAVAVILERAVFFWTTRERLGSRSSVQQGRLSRPDGDAIRINESASMEARIVGAAVSSASAREAEEKITGEAALQRLRAERSLAYLGTLGNNAPFVGLLGTVIGIMGAFGELDASGGQLTAGLMAEIGEALVATAVGLLVALPAVAAYNAFQRTIAVRLARGDAWARLAVARLHLGEPKDAEVKRSAA